MKSRNGSDDRQREFQTTEDFISFASHAANPRTRVNFTHIDGRVEVLDARGACAALRSVSLFLSAPQRIDSFSLDDGRMAVAQHNAASLTQHLRWACGMDHDSKPQKYHREEAEARPATAWGGTALLWFWHNGGDPLPGCSGRYEDWAQVKAPRDVLRDPGRYVREVPPAHECEVTFP